MTEGFKGYNHWLVRVKYNDISDASSISCLKTGYKKPAEVKEVPPKASKTGGFLSNPVKFVKNMITGKDNKKKDKNSKSSTEIGNNGNADINNPTNTKTEAKNGKATTIADTDVTIKNNNGNNNINNSKTTKSEVQIRTDANDQTKKDNNGNADIHNGKQTESEVQNANGTEIVPPDSTNATRDINANDINNTECTKSEVKILNGDAIDGTNADKNDTKCTQSEVQNEGPGVDSNAKDNTEKVEINNDKNTKSEVKIENAPIGGTDLKDTNGTGDNDKNTKSEEQNGNTKDETITLTGHEELCPIFSVLISKPKLKIDNYPKPINLAAVEGTHPTDDVPCPDESGKTYKDIKNNEDYEDVKVNNIFRNYKNYNIIL